MKKQSRFDMQRKIIEELLEQAKAFQKELDALEIGISFEMLSSAKYNADAKEIVRLCLLLNIILQKNRKFVLRYISAVTGEESAELASQLQKVLCEFGEGGVADMKVKEMSDTEMVPA